MQTVSTTAAPPPAPLRFPRGLTRWLGICQICIAIIVAALNIYAVSISGYIPSVSYPSIPCVFSFIIAGSLEIAASCRRTAFLVIGTIIMCYISAGFAIGALLVIASISIKTGPCIDHVCHLDDEQRAVFNTVCAVLAFLASLETVVAVWTSTLGFRAVCCCDIMTSGDADTSTQWTTSRLHMTASPAT